MSKGQENVQNMSIMCPNFGHFMDMFVSDFFIKKGVQRSFIWARSSWSYIVTFKHIWETGTSHQPKKQLLARLQKFQELKPILLYVTMLAVSPS